MHFTGMLAFHLPVPIAYDVPLVVLSILIACAGALVALLLASRRVLGGFQLLAGGIAIGAGIAGLHYLDMDAMRMARRYCRWRLRRPSMPQQLPTLLVALPLALASGRRRVCRLRSLRG
jgi:NO-binding membrane sensor protein with MHYT domain